MQQATAIKPDAAVLWLELGIAQTGLKKYDDAHDVAEESTGSGYQLEEAEPGNRSSRQQCVGRGLRELQQDSRRHCLL